ncbi:aldo/keto reductase [Kitasatospora sp. NPDC057198]|uniref:aldo/keto reductase n=1 Tax=Kitasatospora sp. NPDC057198 TaxID=3346046 RepID=UPI003644DE3F
MTIDQEPYTSRKFTPTDGPALSRIGFGTMRLPLAEPAAARKVLRRAVESGVDHFDTASFYFAGDRAANALLREALHPYPEQVSIAVKVGPQRTPDGAFSAPATAAELRGAVERNLRELGVERLDLVYLRIGAMAPDPGESLAERFAVLAELRRAGLVGALGVSNVTAGQLAEARAVAPVAAVQNHFNLARRTDQPLLAQCRALGIAYVPFPPLAGGDFTAGPAGAVARRIAEAHGATVPQVLLAWLLALGPHVCPIPGTSSPAHLADNLAAADLELSPAELAELDGLVEPAA